MNHLKTISNNNNCINTACKNDYENYFTSESKSKLKTFYKEIEKKFEIRKCYILNHVEKEVRGLKTIFHYKLNDIYVCKYFFF